VHQGSKCSFGTMSKGMLIKAHRRLKALKLSYDHLIRKEDLHFYYE
jgi:hypothetical protein